MVLHQAASSAVPRVTASSLLQASMVRLKDTASSLKDNTLHKDSSILPRDSSTLPKAKDSSTERHSKDNILPRARASSMANKDLRAAQVAILVSSSMASLLRAEGIETPSVMVC